MPIKIPNFSGNLPSKAQGNVQIPNLTYPSKLSHSNPPPPPKPPQLKSNIEVLNNFATSEEEKLELAVNPETHPEILANLGMPENLQSVRKLVANNPNTPVDILLNLIIEFPHDVVNNPIFELLILEGSDLIDRMGIMELIALLKHSDNLPCILLDQILNHRYPYHLIDTEFLKQRNVSEHHLEELMEHLSYEMNIDSFFAHPRCTDAIKLQMAKKGHEKMKKTLANSCLTGEQSESDLLIKTLIQYSAVPLQAFIVNHKGVTDDILIEILSCAPDESVRSAIASREDLPERVLLQLAQDQSDVVHKALRQNSWIDANIITRLTNNLHPRIRKFIVQHPNTPSHILKAFSHDPLLTGHIARNPNTPVEVLQWLADADNRNRALTQNPTIPDGILQPILTKLAIDPDYTNRRLVARHRKTPQAILEQLAQDPEPKVQRLAQKRLTSD
jgi:hypothetical protein